MTREADSAVRGVSKGQTARRCSDTAPHLTVVTNVHVRRRHRTPPHHARTYAHALARAYVKDKGKSIGGHTTMHGMEYGRVCCMRRVGRECAKTGGVVTCRTVLVCGVCVR